MTVALFVPCFVDQFAPRVGIAALRLLERLGARVVVPAEAACCGQPASNAGYAGSARRLETRYAEAFAAYDVIVTPSGSCAAHAQAHGGAAGTRTHELCQFVHDRFGVAAVAALAPRLDARVGVHLGCHGLRRLGLATPTEAGPDLDGPTGTVRRDVVRALLAAVGGLGVVDLDRPDECCGFGGTFAVAEPDVSAKMGRDRLADAERHGAQALVSTDPSCLLHLGGLARRRGAGLPTFHVAEVLLAGTGEAALSDPLIPARS